LMTIMTIMSMSSLFKGDFGLFYSLPKNVGMLFPTTDILDTYIYRGLKFGRLSLPTAAGLYQSVMGLVMVVGANFVIQKIRPENSLF